MSIFLLSSILLPDNIERFVSYSKSKGGFNLVNETVVGDESDIVIGKDALIELCLSGLALSLSRETTYSDIILFKQNTLHCIESLEVEMEKVLSGISITKSQLINSIMTINKEHRFVILRRLFIEMRGNTIFHDDKTNLFITMLLVLVLTIDTEISEVMDSPILFSRLSHVNNTFHLKARNPLGEIYMFLDYVISGTFSGLTSVDLGKIKLSNCLMTLYTLIVIFKNMGDYKRETELLSDCLTVFPEKYDYWRVDK